MALSVRITDIDCVNLNQETVVSFHLHLSCGSLAWMANLVNSFYNIEEHASSLHHSYNALYNPVTAQSRGTASVRLIRRVHRVLRSYVVQLFFKVTIVRAQWKSGWKGESGSPVVGLSRAAPRWLDGRQQLTGGRSVDRGSPLSIQSRVAPFLHSAVSSPCDSL